MTLLIAFIGCVIARFSIRYLDGEATQGRFFRWTAFALGAVLTLVVAGNLPMFTAAWILTSLGLHQLLTHYADRPAAMLAARKKFTISRLGDMTLLCALALAYGEFGTFDFQELFNAAQSASTAPSWNVSLVGLMFVLGAMTKSAQVPMHSWLPDTMETPTPASALTHAEVVNAGGLLVIRLGD